MVKKAYQHITFRPQTMELIETVNTILDEYISQGYRLSLRQVYYQLVARALIANKDTEYNRLGSIVSDGRLAGLIDWDAIEDRGRFLRSLNHWRSPREILDAVASQYRIDKWATQPHRVEVWVEKDALVGVIQAACEPLDVPCFSCRGYASQTALYEAGRRLRSYSQRGQEPIILHFGDHDPSGRDMTRDIRERLELFGERYFLIERLALNMSQVDQYNPPPNPAKMSDSRARAYIAEFGNESWELDALEPTVLGRLIQDTVYSYRDAGLWADAVDREDEERTRLERLSQEWDDE